MDNDELRGLLAKLDEHSDGDYLSRLANGACIASDCAAYLREHGARLLADSEAYAKLRARIAGAAEKWRGDAAFYRSGSEPDKSVAYDRCADELVALLPVGEGE